MPIGTSRGGQSGNRPSAWFGRGPSRWFGKVRPGAKGVAIRVAGNQGVPDA